MRMQTVRGVRPFAIETITAIDSAGARGHAERTHEAHIRIAGEDFALRLVGKERCDHTVAIEIKAIHEVEPQPRPSSVTTSI